MKKEVVVSLMILSILMTLIPNLLFGVVGCMDKSRHTNNFYGYDQKTLHYVACNCNCPQSRRIARKNMCLDCGHFHEPKKVVLIN